MTRMKHSPIAAVDARPVIQPFELQWASVASADDDRVRTHRSRATAELSLHLSIHSDADGHVRVDAAVQQPGAAHNALLAVTDAICDVQHDGPMQHVTITDARGRNLLIATLRHSQDSGTCEVLYARTPLLVIAGLTGGRCDPPTAAMLD